MRTPTTLVLAAACVLGPVVAGPAAEADTPTAPVLSRISEALIEPDPGGRAEEPIVATHPTDPSRLAVVYERTVDDPLEPVVSVSDDGGETWHVTGGPPWEGSGRLPDLHAVIAWGPGTQPGSARLYWADVTFTAGDSAAGFLPSVAYSDDEGAHWSPLRTFADTRPWVGGFPEIAVDRDPRSPSFGTVYVAYNWLADPALGPGLHVLASADRGRTWAAAEVPPAPSPAGYPAHWRIGYRLAPAEDGSAYVAGFQADMRAWDRDAIFSRGGLYNVGRLGYSVTRLRLDPARHSLAVGPTVMAVTLSRNVYTVDQLPDPGTGVNVFLDPSWQAGLAVDAETGRVLLAVGDVLDRSPGPRGRILVARSDDDGRDWSSSAIPALPLLGGLPQSAVRPDLVAVGGGTVIVTLQGMVDLPWDAVSPDPRATVGAAYAVSTDDGTTFAAPGPVDAARWPAWLATTDIRGPGLRDRAARAANGDVAYAWGDGRTAVGDPGHTSIVVARIRPAPASPTPAMNVVGRAIAA